MRKLVLGFDFDGVYTNCPRLKSDGIKKLFGKDVLPEHCSRRLVVGRGILTDSQYSELQSQIYGTPYFMAHTEEVTGAIRYTKKLIERGHDLRIITARKQEWADLARKWLKRRGLNLRITATEQGNKSDACRGLDFFVDDDVDKLFWLRNYPKCNLYLFSWPSNAHEHIPEEIRRIGSWQEIYHEVNKLQRKEKLQEKLEKSGIAENCVRVASKLGQDRGSRQGDCYTNRNYLYDETTLTIDCDIGCNMQGDGRLIVKQLGKVVFEISNSYPHYNRRDLPKLLGD